MVYLLRWYWWRINAWSEISAMIAAMIGSILAISYFGYTNFADKMIFTTLFTTVIWLVTTFLTSPESKEKLESFYNKIKPLGPGWSIFEKHSDESIATGPFINIIIAIIVVQGFLFGIGQLILGSSLLGLGLIIIALVSTRLLIKRIN